MSDQIREKDYFGFCLSSVSIDMQKIKMIHRLYLTKLLTNVLLNLIGQERGNIKKTFQTRLLGLRIFNLLSEAVF